MAVSRVKLAPEQVLLVLGVRGAGKSRYVQDEIVDDAASVIVWDVHGEYWTRERVSLDYLLDNPAMLDQAGLSLSVVPAWRNRRELCDQFTAFADVVQTFSPTTVLVVEECRLLKGEAAESMVYLATQSRHWEVPLVFVSQRAIGIPKDAREQCSRIVSFRQSSPDDVAALCERCPGAGAERVQRLPRWEHWDWDESQSFE